MKRNNAHSMWPFILLFAVLSAAIVGCKSPTTINTSNNALLILGFADPGRAAHPADSKAIVPSGLAVSSIEVELSGPGGVNVHADSEGAPIELELVPGAWVVSAKGFNSESVLIVEGSLELQLEPSECVSRTLVLRPIAGSGSISLRWSLQGELGGALSVTGSIEDAKGEIRAIESPFSRPEDSPLVIADLPSGSWKLRLSLLCEGETVCGLADAILVAANMTTLVSIVFSPPRASMALSFLIPDYESTSLSIEPAVRRAAVGARVAFKADCEAPVTWYSEGAALACASPLLQLDVLGAASSLRIDCIYADAEGLYPPRSGSARLIQRAGQELAGLRWIELLIRSEQDSSSQVLARGLSDCRDLAWSPSGRFLAAASRDSNTVSLFDAADVGAIFPLAFAGGAAEPALAAPTRLRFVSDMSILALSESRGALYTLAIEASPEEPVLRLANTFIDPLLAGAKDMAVVPADNQGHATSIYVAAQDSDSVILLSLDENNIPVSAKLAAAPGAGELAYFSRPSCAALDTTGGILAVGTCGDDAIYLFSRDSSSGGLTLRQRINKTAFPASAPLSDPCALVFAPDSASLYALSYYGKAVIRLDRDAATGAFNPVAGARSGNDGVQGFATPRALGLNPEAGLVVVAGSGSEDGIAAFDLSSPGELRYLGSILPPEGDAVPPRPMTLAFSPDGTKFGLASDGLLSIFTASP